MARRQKQVLAACLALAIISAFDGAEAAKKRSKGKKKVAKLEPLKCGVCSAIVEVVREEVHKKENDTSTLDLRWGLTAEVKEGKARRLGKVIPYKRSELLATEIMDRACNSIIDYGVYYDLESERQLIKMSVLNSMERQEGYTNPTQEDKDKDVRATERHCEDIVDSSADKIIRGVRDDLNHTQFVDALCYGEASAFCGETRAECLPGTYGSHMGLAPCSLCSRGFWQSEFKMTECFACKPGYNTSALGSKSAGRCMPVCAPGSFSANGLDMTEDEGHSCRPCEAGWYQDKSQQRECVRCPGGTNTLEAGAASKDLCVDLCGDGMKTASEGCDDGNTADGDGCSSKCESEHASICSHTPAGRSGCRLVVCGDGKREEADGGSVTEECDDGNTQDGDGCSGACGIEASAHCGDLAIGSSSKCNKVVCGDGRVQASRDGQVSETCDDGNEVGGDGCSAVCGVETGAMCRQDNDKAPSQCRAVTCGDSHRDESNDGTRVETCDDGNTAGGDGCSEVCKVEEEHICWGEPGKDSLCRKVRCGDGFRESAGGGASEECDDGNEHDSDGCSASCKVESGFECKEVPGSPKRSDGTLIGPPGFLVAGRDACSRKQICGDGFRVGEEDCDDGNSADSDGCSASCKVEEGYKCAAPRPSPDAPLPAPGEALPDECVLKRVENKDGPDKTDQDDKGGDEEKNAKQEL